MCKYTYLKVKVLIRLWINICWFWLVNKKSKVWIVTSYSPSLKLLKFILKGIWRNNTGTIQAKNWAIYTLKWTIGEFDKKHEHSNFFSKRKYLNTNRLPYCSVHHWLLPVIYLSYFNISIVQTFHFLRKSISVEILSEVRKSSLPTSSLKKH